jgi:hypothetical protein
VRKGIPKEAWAAIGVIGAAAVTGLVTIVVNSGDSSPPAASTEESTRTTNATATSPVAEMVGSWRGVANTDGGVSFTVELVIERACRIGELCGSIAVPDVPCYGQVYLESVSDGEVAFRVTNFDARSDLSTCQEGGGERFRLREDGKLDYRTTYEPVASGVLNRS